MKQNGIKIFMIEKKSWKYTKEYSELILKNLLKNIMKGSFQKLQLSGNK